MNTINDLYTTHDPSCGVEEYSGLGSAVFVPSEDDYNSLPEVNRYPEEEDSEFEAWKRFRDIQRVPLDDCPL